MIAFLAKLIRFFLGTRHNANEPEAADQTERSFNHDLMIKDDDAENSDRRKARRRWPQIAHVLIDARLADVFKPYEDKAKELKRRVQRVGTGAVILMLASLLGSAAELWVVHQISSGTALRLFVESARFWV